MLQFRCGGCGNRIAVAKRHLGRLCQCPECGGTTHPLAAQLDTGRNTCENCGERLGKLEQPRHWRGYSVCNRCHGSLANAALASPLAPTILETPVVATGETIAVSAVAVEPHRRRFNGDPAGADLNAGALGVVAGFLIMAAAFMVAMTLLSYIGLFAALLLFIGMGVLGAQRLWRGTALLRERASDLRRLRLEHGRRTMMRALAAGSVRSRRPLAAALSIVALIACGLIWVIGGLLIRIAGRGTGALARGLRYAAAIGGTPPIQQERSDLRLQ